MPTGEVGRMGAPKRREVGHGALAERAILPVLPNEDEFPYSIRVVSEVLESNGSSSMASTCGSCLALMDAGVPIKAPVSGVAMGLIKEDDGVVILSDIQGLEDFLGDMDFKVTGTPEGITALQMDNKARGLSTEILGRALAQAKEGRAHILSAMLDEIAAPRAELRDTAPSYQITHAPDLIIEDARKLGRVAKDRAFELADALCVGRTHGIHAEPMTFGMKFGSWAWALKRSLTRLEQAREVAATGAISGAVGTYSSIDPFVEAYVCEHMGLVPDPLSTQVLARDRHAQVASTLAVVASTLESIAMQVRLMQQTDVIEAEEPFRPGQKGSSAMPHKRNPITVERVCGLSRIVKANAQVSFDDVALWYERDISHSGAERVALADSFIALDYMFAKMQFILEGLQVYPEKMKLNLDRTRGLIFSSKVLLALVDTGITREAAYAIVQRNAMAVWSDIQNAVVGPTYRERLEADPEANLAPEKLDEIFDPWAFLAHKDVVFKKLESLTF